MGMRVRMGTDGGDGGIVCCCGCVCVCVWTWIWVAMMGDDIVEQNGGAVPLLSYTIMCDQVVGFACLFLKQMQKTRTLIKLGFHSDVREQIVCVFNKF
jgi:hypothetical protein